jgi:hypothetical protein
LHLASAVALKVGLGGSYRRQVVWSGLFVKGNAPQFSPALFSERKIPCVTNYFTVRSKAKEPNPVATRKRVADQNEVSEQVRSAGQQTNQIFICQTGIGQYVCSAEN